MKKLFPGYYEYSEEAKRNIWKNGIFVFDTCVLLNIYFLSPQKNALITILKKLKSRIKIPYQIAEEYHKNLFQQIFQQYDHFQKIDNTVNQLRAYIQDGSYQKLFDKNENMNILSALDQIQNKISQIKQNDYYADLRDNVASLLSGAIENRIESNKIAEWKKIGENRYKQHIPPGFHDKDKDNNNQYGDFIIWQSLMDISRTQQKPVIFITEDQKNDWFIKNHGKLHPHPQLCNEFLIETQQNILLYTLAEFLEEYKKYVPSSSVDPKILQYIIMRLKEYEDAQAQDSNESNSNAQSDADTDSGKNEKN